MSIYSLIYLILAGAILVYMLKHKLDLLCIAGVCFIVYTIYCIPGVGISGFYRPHLSPKLYSAVYIQLCIIIGVTLYIRKKEDKKQIDALKILKINDEPKSSILLDKSFMIYTFIIACFAVLNIISIGFSTFLSGKSNVWQNTNVFFIISLYGAFPSFAYGIHFNKKLIWITSTIIELTIFLAGARAFAATLIVILLCDKGQKFMENRKKSFKMYIVGGLAVVFLLIYRSVDTLIMQGDFEGAVQTLSKSETWLSAMEFNEPRVIIANYDYVLSKDFRLPIGDTIYRFLDLIPGMTRFIPIELKYPEYFSTFLQAAVNGSTGVGGTIWGESYAMFGMVGIFVCTFIWLLILKICNYFYNFKKPYSPFIVALGTYWAWYINRLDYNRVFQVGKVLLLCFLMWWIVYSILRLQIKIPTKVVFSKQ